MFTRVSRPLRSVSIWFLGLAILLATLVAPAAVQPAAGQLIPAQSFSPTASAEPAASAVNSLPSTVGKWIEKGQTLEGSGRWAEALSHFEEALREHPEEPTLTDHFDTARIHYSLEQRYDDRSFQNSVKTLSSRDSLDLYGDLLAKIGTHYYTVPPWRDLFNRGAQSLDIALTERKFLATNGIQASANQVEQLRASLRQLSARYQIGSRADAMNVVTQAAQLARRQIGLSESATILEFTAAAASALDHYSAFLTADQLRDIYSQIEGNFVGLGVELKADNGALLIVHVIPNSPAQGAGILDGDRIIAVAGQSTGEMSTDEAATLLTGPEGSVCRVSVVTAGQSPRELNVRRAHVEVPSLEDVKIIDPAHGVAYVRIPAFQKTTARDLETALWDLHAKGMRSLVLDLRGNPGGLLTASVEVADKFIADGPIVSTRGRSEQENFNYRAHRPGTWRVPLVVLIDGDSASASEIFAAAIKDSGRGKVIGCRSYGKGSVQGIFPLGYAGAGARITTAKFFSPMGNPIANVGVTPDIDTRRGKLVADGGSLSAGGPALNGASGNMYQVGFRGVSDNSASAPAASASASGDSTLDV
ncbi:MAG: S41 family peptidase, partial [Pirellulales bacterium]